MAGAVNPISPIDDYNPPTFANPSQWDVVILQGITCPGICTISGFERKWVLDKKKGKGAQGVSVTYVGEEAAEGEVTFSIWTGQQRVLWQSFRPLFLYDPTRTTLQAVDIYHPSLRAIGISKVICEWLSPEKHVGSNLYQIVAKLVEWKPPPNKSAVATPTTAKTNSGSGVGGNAKSPLDPLQQKIADLYKQFQQT